MAGNDLAVAYVQMLPSFDKFYARLRSEAANSVSKFEKFGADAGKAWSKGFAANAKAATPTTSTATPSGGGGSDASAGSTSTAIVPTGVAAAAGAEFGAIEAAATASGAATAAKWAKGFTSAGSGLSAIGTGLTAGVTVPLAAVGVLSAKAAIDFESAFAGVRKTVDATDAEFQRLSDGIRDLAAGANASPLPVEQIARIVELGGQLGIPNDQLLAFADTISRLSVSLEGIDPETAALQIAQFAAITDMPTSNIDNFGAALTELGNNFQTTEGPILQFALRLAGQGKIIGLTTQEILAFSTALASVGIMPEAGGTAFSRVFQRINDAVGTGSAELEQFSAIAGMTSEKFTKLFNDKPAQAINAFTIGLGQLSDTAATTTPILEELGLADVRVRDGVQRLSNTQDKLGETLDYANRGWRENTALIEESNKRFGTTESQLSIAKNRLNDVGIELGNSLTPAIADLLEAIEPLINVLGTAVEVFGKLPQPIQTTAISVGVFAAALGPLSAFAGLLTTAVGGAVTSLSSFLGASAAATAGAEATTAATSAMSASMTGVATTTSSASVALGRFAGSSTGAAAGIARISPALLNLARGTSLLVAYLALAGTSKIADFFTGQSNQATAALDDLNKSVDEGKGILESFQEVAQNKPPFSVFQGVLGTTNLQNVFRGDAQIAEDLAVQWTDVDRAIKEVGNSGGVEALDQLRVELEKQRNEVDRNSQAYKDLAGVINQVDKERRGRSPDGQSYEDRTAELAAQAELERQQANVNAGFEAGVVGAQEFEKALTAQQQASKLAAVATDSAAAAAARYSKSIENLGFDDDLLQSGLAFSQAFRTAREQAGLQESEADRQARTRAAAQAQDQLATKIRDSATDTSNLTGKIRALNPQLEIMRINTEAAAAAGDAFRKSIGDSSYIDDVIGSTVSLGDAYRAARKVIRALPADLDLAAVSLGKLKPRQERAVQGVLALGKATTDYLATLIQSGRASSDVIGEADRLRQAYVEQFRQLGFNEEQIQRYLEAMGLTPEQITTAIRVSGLEMAQTKLDAYASLLQGKIPGTVASAVIASIESGDLEGAARQLANFAATNPVDIPVTVEIDQPAITAAQDALDRIEKDILDLPDAYDIVTATFGGYTQDQERGLSTIISLGETAQQQIAKFIEAGDYEGARALAARFREEISALIRELNPNANVDQFIDDLLQLSKIDIETSISVSGLDQAIVEIGLYQDILKALGQGIPQEVLNLLLPNIRDRNFAGVAEILKQFTSGLPQFNPSTPGASGANPSTSFPPVTLPPGVEFPVLFNVEEAEDFLATWVLDNETGEPVLVPATADTEEADLVVAEWRQNEEGDWVIVDTGSDPQKATEILNAWRNGEARVPAIPPIEPDIGPAERTMTSWGLSISDPKTAFTKLIDGDTGLLEKGLAAFELGLSLAGPILVDLAIDAARFIDNVGKAFGVGFNAAKDLLNRVFGLKLASGGYIYGDGGPTADRVPAMLSAGEYVIRAGAVRSLGVDFLDKLNKGYVPGFAMGGLVDSQLTTPAISTGGVNIDYTVVESKSNPTPEDLLRVTRSAIFLGSAR